MIFAKEIARVVIPLIFILLVVCTYFYKKKIEPTLSENNRMIVKTGVLIIFVIISIWAVASIFF